MFNNHNLNIFSKKQSLRSNNVGFNNKTLLHKINSQFNDFSKNGNLLTNTDFERKTQVNKKNKIYRLKKGELNFNYQVESPLKQLHNEKTYIQAKINEIQKNYNRSKKSLNQNKKNKLLNFDVNINQYKKQIKEKRKLLKSLT